MVASIVAAVTAAALFGCAASPANPEQAGPQSQANSSVTVVTHASFALSGELKERFKQVTGYDLRIIQSEDAGTMVGQLILAKDNPVADAVAGIDNTFASKAIEAGIFDPYTSPAAGSEQDRYAVDQSGSLTAFDTADVCINYDKAAYGSDRPPPASLQDLTKEAYRDQLVVASPVSSSPGMAFMLATVAAFGQDGWLDYWRQLVGNGVKIVSSWEEAYYTEFSGPSSSGQRPLVLSYASSPPAEIVKGTSQPATAALPETCFRQVEYAGVLKGAANPDGARAWVDFVLSDEFQAALPESMWVYPVKEGIALPSSWAKCAAPAAKPWALTPVEISQNREAWSREWIEVALG
ncbi:MAG: thiamine ABC transporter substrate-binding protein [Micrococcales bacterium]|nr:thiamine ABC transporter substrate-binding protein [Micrococcales bacterium]